MRDSPHNNIPSSIEIDREIEIDRYTTPHTPHTPHIFVEPRQGVNIRMKKSLHQAFMIYCGKKMTAGDFYEKAGILYIENNPSEAINITIIEPTCGEQTLDDEIQEIICVEELQTFIKNRPRGRPLHIDKKRELLKLLKECRKVNNRGVCLEELMLEAKKYFA